MPAPTVIVSAAAGVVAGTMTARETLTATAGARREFDLFDDNVQVVTVRVASSGAASSFRVASVEVDVAVYDVGVQGGV